MTISHFPFVFSYSSFNKKRTSITLRKLNLANLDVTVDEQRGRKNRIDRQVLGMVTLKCNSMREECCIMDLCTIDNMLA